MKGNRGWPGEEECIHLAGSFLCIHLGSSRSASCSDQAFIRLQAAQTQLAQYGRENRFPRTNESTFLSQQCWKTDQERNYSQHRTVKHLPVHGRRLSFHIQPWEGELPPPPGDHQPKLLSRLFNSQEVRASCSHPAHHLLISSPSLGQTNHEPPTLGWE